MPKRYAPAALRNHFIRKNGYFYRPDRAGYTAHPFEAGRYTRADALKEQEGVEGATAVPVREWMLDWIDLIEPYGLYTAHAVARLLAIECYGQGEGDLITVSNSDLQRLSVVRGGYIEPGGEGTTQTSRQALRILLDRTAGADLVLRPYDA